MVFPPEVVLLDDGNLTDVRDFLKRLGIEHLRLSKAAFDPEMHVPTALLLTTANLAQSLRGSKALDPLETPELTQIVFLDEATSVAPVDLMQGGSIIIRHPVHWSSLEFFILESLYRGTEKRRAERVPVGESVEFLHGQRSHAATLVDLSTSGCRLLTLKAMRAGTTFKVVFRERLTRGEEPAVFGRVIRTEQIGKKGAIPDLYSLGVQFLEPELHEKAAISEILRCHARGRPSPSGEECAQLHQTKTLEESMVQTEDKVVSKQDAVPETPRATRCMYTETVVLRADEKIHVLRAQDLSVTGIYIEGLLDLAVGQEVQIVLEEADLLQSITVKARVVRDDGIIGLALQFDRDDPALTDPLEDLVSSKLLQQLRPKQSQLPH